MPRKRPSNAPMKSGRNGGFNEAGALCPGKGRGRVRRRRDRAARFNEAGALCPGKGLRSCFSSPSETQLQ